MRCSVIGDLWEVIRQCSMLLSVLLVLPFNGAQAQSVQKKQLITSMGGGIGMLDLDLDVDSFSTSGSKAGTIRFAFAYAISDRWSLGFHYDRIGTDTGFGEVDRVRLTTYILEGT